MRLAAGVRLGPYEVVALLGAGGMAEVYRARDIRLGREVAVKVVSEALGTDGAFVERFEREARLVGSVTHPNVVALHDVGVHDGKPYFVTELLQGETLRARLEKGPVALPTALDWASQMAGGLAAAHERGIVHRDLKPENVLITRDGHLKLLDFGIAKVIASAREPQPTDDASSHGLLQETLPSGGGRTATGFVIGTPGYMSPEQVRGDPVDGRTDLFSLGAVLYELVSGRRAFQGKSPVETSYAVLHQEPEPLGATVPPAVAQVIARCLEKEPGRRFQSARDLAFHLEVLRAPTTGSTTVASTPLVSPGRRWRWMAAAAALVLLAVATGLWMQGRKVLNRDTAAEGARGAQTEGTPSIAVLPFVNLSSDKEQEYFSDGITEELLDALARVKGLKVAGRTSSFQFKGKNVDLRTIGETLGVANIVEGSVRKQGNRVRITAQLIKAVDGFHLWSHTFEGDLTNVFDLQEKIARSITEELKVVLTGDSQSRLVPRATQNPDAYALYLRATAIFNRREGDKFHDAIGYLEDAVRLDPGYARAWARLGALWALSPNYGRAPLATALSSAEQAAHHAGELDPSLAEPQAVLGLVSEHRREFLKARAFFLRALELDADDVTANFWFASHLMCAGYVRDANRRYDRLLTLDPMHPNALNWRANGAIAEGDVDLAERLMLRAREAGLSFAGLGLSYVSEARGRTQDAVAGLTQGLTALSPDLPTGLVEAISRGIYGDVQARQGALTLIQRYLATPRQTVNGAIPYGLIRLGRPAEALALFARGPTENDSLPLAMLWLPYGRSARTSAEFPEEAQRIGLVEMWEHVGPPDLCHRTEPQKWVCQ